jgi:hypothetical protein
MKRTWLLGVSAIFGMLATAAFAGVGPAAPPAPADQPQAKADVPSWKKTTYLGVTTAPVGDTLGAQLKLPPGVGLVASFSRPSGRFFGLGIADAHG